MKCYNSQKVIQGYYQDLSLGGCCHISGRPTTPLHKSSLFVPTMFYCSDQPPPVQLSHSFTKAAGTYVQDILIEESIGENKYSLPSSLLSDTDEHRFVEQSFDSLSENLKVRFLKGVQQNEFWKWDPLHSWLCLFTCHWVLIGVLACLYARWGGVKGIRAVVTHSRSLFPLINLSAECIIAREWLLRWGSW